MRFRVIGLMFIKDHAVVIGFPGFGNRITSPGKEKRDRLEAVI